MLKVIRNKEGLPIGLNRMNPQQKLFLLKLLHTVIWIFFVGVIFYILYSGITNRINIYTWISIGLIVGEGLTLVLFKMFCPITVLARKYSDSDKDNFDIFLPNWLARHNKIIFTSIYVVGVIIVLLRVVL